MGSLLEELKRRKVFRVAAVYAVVSWVIIQVADTLFPALQLPEWTITFITVLLILGFFPTMVVAWAYQRSADGIKPHGQVQSASGPIATSAQPINYIILAIVLLVAGIQVFDRFNQSVPDRSMSVEGSATDEGKILRTEFSLGPLERRTPLDGNFITTFDFSADGSELFFSSFQEGVHRLNGRRLDERTIRILLESPDSLASLRVSPDGQWVALHQSRGLSIQPVSGGNPRVVADRSRPNSHAWLDENTLIYQEQSERNSVYRYSIDSADSELLFDGDSLVLFQSPLFIPGSNHLIYTTVSDVTFENYGNPILMLIDMGTGESRVLLDDAYDARLLGSDRLVFMRNNDLWGSNFDSEALDLVGNPVNLVTEIENESDYFFASYAISSEGMLAYLPGGNISSLGQSYLLWRDAAGNEEPLDLEPGYYEDIALSRDGQLLALTMHEGASIDGLNLDIWTYDFDLPGILNRVTTFTDAQNPVWALDQQSLYFDRRFRSANPTTRGVWQVSASGIGEAQPLIPFESNLFARHVGPNGELLMQSTARGPYDPADLFIANPVAGETTAIPLIASEYGEGTPSISPDGRLIAYEGNETGNREIHVRPFPDVNSNKWRVSNNGGIQPLWGNNGELYYLENDTPPRLVTLQIDYGSDFRVESRSISTLENYNVFANPGYQVDSNTGRLLFLKYVDSGNQTWGDGEQAVIANLVSNFTTELDSKVSSAKK